MNLKIIISREFKREYKKLTKTERKAIFSALLRMRRDPKYPSLRIKKMQKYKNLWEARASRDLRILFLLDGHAIYLVTCGHHKVEDR